MKASRIKFNGLSSASESEQAMLRARIIRAVDDFEDRTGMTDIEVRACRRNGHMPSGVADTSENKLTEDFKFDLQACQPEFTFERVCLPEKIRETMLSSVATIEHERKLFEEWGLSEIQAHARAAILFNGPPGTGKTATAHGLASHLGQKILSVTTADLESKYLGEGPKLVAAFFAAVREQNALAFIDEADTLLGSRMKVTQGSERAANSMTSQLLIELEKHNGVVVFATNLVDNIDHAFTTRVLRIDFPLPDKGMRYELWKNHLPEKLPLDGVDIDALSEIDGICGRDIRNAIVLAASRAVSAKKLSVAHDDILYGLNKA
ncbi:ATP-binding protein [Gimesia maris]|uniref:ATP-dependent zinc metalloprotease FtsH 2 n=1 Tax=Gimesia maris TaxID=122 RepID=A0ABX5YR42_9PLAN|nr:ATP-binding protein [Gimesia maris]EDL59248.1 possible AAA ATPase family protein [Gimesia maris DSM 8797]QEG18214.1 ATP-dependent zinc metalloprotease FtsH 2 [Gimesia maris]QGQ28785.1 AAA family ATPase [Gimesia maris]